MELIDHGRGLLTLEGQVRLPGGFLLPARSTLLSLSDGSWALLSPLAGIGAHQGTLQERGGVSAIVSPSVMHHLGLAEAHAAFPAAPLFALAGVQGKQPGLPLAGVLADVPVPLWEKDLEHHVVRGLSPAAAEVAFFHKASRTLVLTDLCFHVNTVDHWPTRVMMRLNGGLGRFGPTRLIKTQIKDKQALARSVDELVAWDPERVVVAHGDVVQREGARRLAEAFSYLRPST